VKDFFLPSCRRFIEMEQGKVCHDFARPRVGCKSPCRLSRLISGKEVGRDFCNRPSDDQ